MAKIKTTEDLIETSLRRALIPSDQSTFTDDDIMDIMNEELGIHILPMVMRAHEEYYVYEEDVPLVSGTVSYKIPYRAVGNKFREVQYLDSSGTTHEMTRITVEDRPEWQSTYTTSRISGFYITNDEVVMANSTIPTGSLRFSYYLRPNDLVESDRGGVITNIVDDGTTTVLTLSAFPVHFSTTNLFDFISGKSPSKIMGFDRPADSFDSAAQTITFLNSDLTLPNVYGTGTKQIIFTIDDHVMKAEESFVCQIPTELQPILAQRTAIKMLEALGDVDGMKMAQNELERMEYNSQTLIDNRAEGSPQKISNRHSILKSALSDNAFRRGGY